MDRYGASNFLGRAISINTNKILLHVMGKYEYHSRSARITTEQDEWLSKHPEIVFSALVREAIETRMKREK